MTISRNYSSKRCNQIVEDIYKLVDYYGNKLNMSDSDIDQLSFACGDEWDTEHSDRFSKPMVWIGIYIATASLFCILAMAADLLHGIRSKNYWFPCKFFSLNAASITVIAVAMKLTVDLSSVMPNYMDQETKPGSLAFMCTMMANFMPSLASMDNATLLANVIGLSVLAITMVVNICVLLLAMHLVVGTIAPVSRCFSVLSFKLVTQKLHEWKQSPIPFLSISRRSRSIICNSRDTILNFCIGFQKVVVVLCKLIWLVATRFFVNCLYCWKSLMPSWFTPSASNSEEVDEDLRRYVLKIDNKMELSGETLKQISNSMNSFMLKAAKEQNNNLLALLDKSTGFKGVEIFDTDQVQTLLPVELVNSWSLPIVTLTCIVVVLPSIPTDIIENLFKSVGEGLSHTYLVEENLNCSREYVYIRKASMALWHEVGNKCKWLENPLAKNTFTGKTSTEILKWFSDKAKEYVIEINESTNGELMENPSKTLIAANSMYRITQTILLRYQNSTEPFTHKELFALLNGMIADIFCACFTNMPRVITMKCHESVIEKREASVKVAAKLLGKTADIIERLEKREVPHMDDDKMAYIDEWRLYLKQSIP